ncbi:MAG: uroporphyrinogen-III synthase [Flavobacteriaceae bacterium]|nr:uroporphyrinogen-III synthase [Flavobacteriaceae bacterium]
MSQDKKPFILFTKYFQPPYLDSEGKDFDIESYDFIQTQIFDSEKVKTQIYPDCQHFILTSARSAKLISEFRLEGSFYCVGKTSEEILQNRGNNVIFTAPTAQELLNFIEINIKLPTYFTFFCSQIRRDTIPDGLKQLGHHLHEITTYSTHSKSVEINKNYDAVAFFSPSGVKSYDEQYAIPEKAVIFAIGETTAQAARKTFDRDVIFSKNADLESLINLIKIHFNAKK